MFVQIHLEKLQLESASQKMTGPINIVLEEKEAGATDEV